ncbi:MAG TPA: hypothetical protein VNV66_02160, partial [Pilimelia sp.]|nr:hypothetical protein [Pilimelia sp.]
MAVGAWFATDFDAPAVHLGVPVTVTGGQPRLVCVVDQVTRGTGIVGRVNGDFGAVALKVRPTGEPVRVTVDLQLDGLAARWWGDRIRPPRGTAEPPRLVLVRAQGALRGAAVLARPQGWLRAGSARAAVTFDLAAGELDGDGLLVIEIGDPGPVLPDWAAGRLASQAPIGLRIDRIALAPAPG